jgi:para-nitrobenzyl esterase
VSVASTALGDLRGTEEHGVTVFRGVSYAAPPVGPLRFTPPQPLAAWHGLRDATRHGPIAPQTRSRLRAAMGGFECPQDEDCLTLTIWTPRADNARRPVLVWLHGGAWLTGAGSLDWYHGARLAREGDIVVVGVNYRLGVLGYLRHPAVSDGNLGTLDQITALRWIKQHVGGFGGDGERITLAGQSAGAAAIGLMLTMPDVRHLFRRAILQSGGFGRPPRNAEQATTRGEAFIRWLGFDPDAADTAGQLRAVPAQRLVEAQAEYTRAHTGFGNTDPPFGPVLPQRLTSADLIDAITAGVGEADVLIGATREEGHAFFAPDLNVSESALTGAFGMDPVAHLRRRRPGATPGDLLADITTELVFRTPTLRLAQKIARGGSNVFAYQFNWAPPKSPFKACHCIDLPFTFGNLDAWSDAPMLAGGDPAVMHDLSAAIRRAWIAFIRTGNPQHDDMPAWPQHTDGRVMQFDTLLEPVQFGPSA